MAETSGLSEAAFEALKGELIRAAESLSTGQLLDLADALHATIRRRSARGGARGLAGRVREEPRSFGPEITAS